MIQEKGQLTQAQQSSSNLSYESSSSGYEDNNQNHAQPDLSNQKWLEQNINELSTSNFIFQEDSISHQNQKPYKSQKQTQHLNHKQHIGACKQQQNDSFQLKQMLNCMEDKFKTSEQTFMIEQNRMECYGDKIRKRYPNQKFQLRRPFLGDGYHSYPYSYPYQQKSTKKIVQPYGRFGQHGNYRSHNHVHSNQNFQNPYTLNHNFRHENRQKINHYEIQNKFISRPLQFAHEEFSFRNVQISVRLCSILNLNKNILLVPFSSSDFNDSLISNAISKHLKYNMKQIFYKQALKFKEKQFKDGCVFSVKAKGMQNNYKGIYFIKSPKKSNEGLKYYDRNVLEIAIKNVFNLINQHQEYNMVIPEFQWGCLDKKQICEILISSIFRQLNDNKRNYRCKFLRQIIMSVSNCEYYENFAEIFINYTRQML